MTLGLKDDEDSAPLGDRIIAAIIGGLCGMFFGWILAGLALRLFGSGFGLPWVIGAFFAVFAFRSPTRSTEIWSEFWEGVLDLLGRAGPR